MLLTIIFKCLHLNGDGTAEAGIVWSKPVRIVWVVERLAAQALNDKAFDARS